MAKAKKKNLAEHISNKKKSQNVQKAMNPFEMHINKEKMKVLGRKLKNDRGLPGVSRAKALRKRQGTLLQEYKQQNKTNQFLDRRIGERNFSLTDDDRAMARFTAVRAKAHKRKSIFNLADDEVLTHRGQTLSEIEKFDDPRSDDEESIEESNATGKLESDFVKEAHFGGGVLSRTGIQGAKSHKDLINQLIAESKLRKAEKQKTKEKTLELTEKLDTEWKDLIPIVNKTIKQSGDIINTDVDDYDKVIRELRFEARGTPSDRLKSEDEVAKEEKDRLEKLENERQARMRGVTDDDKSQKSKHRSADDLDDDFAYDSEPDMTLSYNEKGALNVPLTENGPEENNEEIQEESEEEVETESEDDLSDLKEYSSSESDEEVREEKESELTKTTKGRMENQVILEKTKKNKQKSEENVEKIKCDLLLRKDMMEKARKELPFTFSLPESYEQLQKVFKNKSPEHVSVIIERMIKCNHPSLNGDNKSKLGMLFVYLLQYINDITFDLEMENLFKTFMALLPQLFDLAQLNPENCQESVMEVIKEKHIEYRKNKKNHRGLEVLLFLKIVGTLFPTSDFRHPVVTPSIVFMDQMLMKCKVRTTKDIAYGLFLVTLILEFTTLSKRYLPASINFLQGILYMAIPKSPTTPIRIPPPFRSGSNSLVLFKNCQALGMSLKLEPTDFTQIEISEDFKIRALHMSVMLLNEFVENLERLSSSREIFDPVFALLSQIPLPNYPEHVQNGIGRALEYWTKLKGEKALEYIVMQAKKPKALRLYEPNVQKIFDTKRHKVMSREKADRAKLLHKLKKERKGALREIRKDKAFLGKVKINQKIQSDKQRRDKVKQIFAEASVQQSELNTLDRKNKRKKW